MNNALRLAKQRLRLAGWDGLQPAIVVLGAKQRLYLLGAKPDGGKIRRNWPVSTGRAGFGNQQDSGRTPTGLHRVSATIGTDAPPGAVFKSRQPTGHIVVKSSDPNADFITTRILWLEGLEPGINQGPGIDTRERYIYIHGTPHTDHLGTPASAGCIRMRAKHVIKLYRLVQPGTLTLILPDFP
ncbi:MAG: L,D-transpeptidase [Magnetococcales bacterium]|nr:L,D-transpeptidase [Magnetococcales bacterium]